MLPERFATGFAIDQAGVGEDDNGLILSWMKSTANANTVVVVGSVIVNHGDKYLNRLYW